MLKDLCLLNGTSGDEVRVRDYIINEIKEYSIYEVDNLGSVIAYKKGKKKPKKTVCINAHMDEVGFIITGITSDGYLRFAPVGGIDTKVCLDRAVTVGENRINGVIADKAYHLLENSEKDKAPSFDKLLIDIGAKNEKAAQSVVSLGDFAYFESDYTELGNGYIKAKALDDRIGCMLMIELIKSELEYDTVFCFNVQEEVGLRGSKCTSFAVGADISIVLEATTAGDLYKLAMNTASENNIPVQTKTAVAGGNDAGSIQTSGKGAKVMALSLPCRYIHSPSSVVKKSDIDNTRKLLKEILKKIYD